SRSQPAPPISGWMGVEPEPRRGDLFGHARLRQGASGHFHRVTRVEAGAVAESLEFVGTASLAAHHSPRVDGSSGCGGQFANRTARLRDSARKAGLEGFG